MVNFRVSVVADASLARAWSVMTDWTAHGRWIPLTAVQPVAGDPGLGSGFVATSRLGPFVLVDAMTVTEWSPPTGDSGGVGSARPSGRCEVTKLGPQLLGGAVIEVWPLADGRTRIDWFEDVRPGPPLLDRLTRPFDPVTGLLSRRMFATAMRKAVRDIEAATEGGTDG